MATTSERGIRAILWDNDGVLVDTEPLFYEATREVLTRFGVDLTLDHYRQLSLREGRSCLDLARERGVPDDVVEQARLQRNVLYHEKIAAGVDLIDGVAETLDALRGRLPMAIVTSSTVEHFDAIHAPLGVRGHFEFVLASGAYAHHKPHPEPYLKASKRIGVAPESCLVIEDSERGLQAAHRAGMRCLVVPNALTASGRFDRAYRVLDDIREVIAVVDRLGDSVPNA